MIAKERERNRWKYKYNNNNDGRERRYHFLSNLHTWKSRSVFVKTETRVGEKKFGTRENLFVHHRLRRRLIRYTLTNSHEEAPKNFGSTVEQLLCTSLRAHFRLRPWKLQTVRGCDKLQCIGVRTCEPCAYVSPFKNKSLISRVGWLFGLSTI